MRRALVFIQEWDGRTAGEIGLVELDGAMASVFGTTDANSATAKLADVKSYGMWRMQRIETFRTARQALLDA